MTLEQLEKRIEALEAEIQRRDNEKKIKEREERLHQYYLEYICIYPATDEARKKLDRYTEIEEKYRKESGENFSWIEFDKCLKDNGVYI